MTFAHPSATSTLAGFLAQVRCDDLPSEVRAQSQRLVLDTLGCLLGGAQCELEPVVSDAAAALGTKGEIYSGARSRRASLLGAVYTNARLANALDFDETFPTGAHFGVGTVAAALAVAQERDCSGVQFLAAVVAGYELGGRVASWLGPVLTIADDRVIGFRQVWGVAAPVVLAAAGATAHLLGLNAEETALAIGLAGANAPLPAGSAWAASVDLPNAKYCDAGWCAVAGVFAALSVRAGSRGFSDLLDEPDSLAAMCGVTQPLAPLLTAELGSRFMIADATYKPWPTCRFTHAALTALSLLQIRLEFRPEDIEEVVIETGPLAASERFTQSEPRTFASRQFSYPHMVAMLLLEVRPGPLWHDASLAASPRVRELAGRVRVERHVDGDGFARHIERNQIRAMPGAARVRLRDGSTHRAEAPFAWGDPWSEETRFGDEDVVLKVSGLVGEAPAARLAEAVAALEGASDLADLLAALDGARGPC